MSEFIDKAKATIGGAVGKVDEKVPDSVKVKASDYADKAGGVREQGRRRRR